jgi:hypothetical protein
LDRRQSHNRQASPGKVLLLIERLIAGDENLNPVFFGGE